jgi:hypothetical protein
MMDRLHDQCQITSANEKLNGNELFIVNACRGGMQ